MTISSLPTSPNPVTRPTTFDADAQALALALPLFVAEVNATAAALNLNSTTDTSTTSITIGTGSKTLTVSAGKSFTGGMYLVIADNTTPASTPSANNMFCQVTSYTGTTLVVNVISITGTGTKTAWVISQSAGGLAVGGSVFSAYLNATQSLSANVTTKLLFGTKEYDTASAYDTTTSKFTPLVPGYYNIKASFNVQTAGQLFLGVYKNGAVYKKLFNITTSAFQASGSCLAYMNGTTDFLEIYGLTSITQNVLAGLNFTYFQGSLVRTV